MNSLPEKGGAGAHAYLVDCIHIAIFSNMAQRQRARYRVAHYVIVNSVTTAMFESKTKNAYVTDRREMHRFA